MKQLWCVECAGQQNHTYLIERFVCRASGLRCMHCHDTLYMRTEHVITVPVGRQRNVEAYNANVNRQHEQDRCVQQLCWVECAAQHNPTYLRERIACRASGLRCMTTAQTKWRTYCWQINWFGLYTVMILVTLHNWWLRHSVHSRLRLHMEPQDRTNAYARMVRDGSALLQVTRLFAVANLSGKTSIVSAARNP